MELSDLNTESVVQTLHTRARDYMRTEIWPSLAKSWRYYDGQLDIPPAYEVQRSVDGRKVAHGDKTIVREVWDKIQAVLPDLARVFLSADEVVSFFPKNQKQEAYYEQATDYINHLFKIENDGENKILDSFISWLIKFCVWKVFWVNKTEQVHRSYRVDQQMFMLLQARLQDPESDIISLEYVEVPQEVPGPDGMPMLEVVYDVELVRQYQEGSVCVELVPPEEFLIDPDAMTSETPLFVGQSTLRTVSEVVSMGVPFEIVQQYSTSGSFGENNEAEVARRGRSNNQAITSVGDISLNYVRVIEALVQLDMDGDGIAEVHRVLMLGESATLINLGPGNDCYYIVGSCYRRPHEPIGSGMAEVTIDLQESKSTLIRGVKNNLNRANTPRPVIRASDNSAYQDLQSPYGPAGDGVIRSDEDGQIQWFVTPYFGDRIFPVIEYFDSMGATRTGIYPTNQGLDPDVLKGMTLDGSKLVMNSGQIRIEYLVREYASMLRQVFVCMLKLVTAFQNKPATIRLRGEWVPVDPTEWEDSMGCEIKVGLGTGPRPDKLAGIMAIRNAQNEERAVQSPLVTPAEVANTLAALAELSGFKTPSRFFKEFNPQEYAQEQAANEEKQKQAAMQAMMLQAQLEEAKFLKKAQIDAETSRFEAQLKDQQLAREDQLKAGQIAADLEKEKAKLAAQTEQEISQQQYNYNLRLKEMELEMELEKYKISMASKVKNEGGGNINREGDVPNQV